MRDVDGFPDRVCIKGCGYFEITKRLNGNYLGTLKNGIRLTKERGMMAENEIDDNEVFDFMIDGFRKRLSVTDLAAKARYDFGTYEDRNPCLAQAFDIFDDFFIEMGSNLKQAISEIEELKSKYNRRHLEVIK